MVANSVGAFASDEDHGDARGVVHLSNAFLILSDPFKQFQDGLQQGLSRSIPDFNFWD
jgi:hypothetical protein